MQVRAEIDAWLDWKHCHLRDALAGIVRRRVMSKIMKDFSNHSMRFDLVEIPEAFCPDTESQTSLTEQASCLLKAREVRVFGESMQILDEEQPCPCHLHYAKLGTESHAWPGIVLSELCRRDGRGLSRRHRVL